MREREREGGRERERERERERGRESIECYYFWVGVGIFKMGLALKAVGVLLSLYCSRTHLNTDSLSNEWRPPALCNWNIYCNFPPSAYFLGFFPTINTFPAPQFTPQFTLLPYQFFNSILTLSLSLSLYPPPLPLIKLSFKENPSLSLQFPHYIMPLQLQNHHQQGHAGAAGATGGAHSIVLSTRLARLVALTVHLFHSYHFLSSSAHIQLQDPFPSTPTPTLPSPPPPALPFGWERHPLPQGTCDHNPIKSSLLQDQPYFSIIQLLFQLCISLGQVGIYYSNNTGKRYLGDATRMSRRNGPKLDLKLNLSPPRANRHAESPSRSATLSPTSPPSSCVSSELNQDETLRYSNSPEATSMVLVGCPRCLMYVMLSEDDPKCPKCKSTVLLDFLHDNNNATTTSSTATSTTKKTKKG